MWGRPLSSRHYEKTRKLGVNRPLHHQDTEDDGLNRSNARQHLRALKGQRKGSEGAADTKKPKSTATVCKRTEKPRTLAARERDSRHDCFPPAATIASVCLSFFSHAKERTPSQWPRVTKRRKKLRVNGRDFQLRRVPLPHVSFQFL